MISEDRYDLKLKIARMLYIDEMTQTQIGAALGISRPTLNKLLCEAKAEGIVKIEICDVRNGEDLSGLAERLKTKLNLKEAQVVGVSRDMPEVIRHELGVAGAKYVNAKIRSGMRIGVGWGKTLESVANELDALPQVKRVSLTPMMGGPVSANDFSRLSNSICEKIAGHYENSTVEYIYAPLYTSDEASCELLRSANGIDKILDGLSAIDMALVGIAGDMQNAITYNVDDGYGFFAQSLANSGVVGNICGRFYDIEGNTGKWDVDKRTIAVSDGQLKAMNNVVAIGGGEHKVKSIIGAARAKFINTLITDKYTALKVQALL